MENRIGIYPGRGTEERRGGRSATNWDEGKGKRNEPVQLLRLTFFLDNDCNFAYPRGELYKALRSIRKKVSGTAIHTADP